MISRREKIIELVEIRVPLRTFGYQDAIMTCGIYIGVLDGTRGNHGPVDAMFCNQ